MIRERAYHLWEAEGRPHGREAEHWERARREFEAHAAPAPNGEVEPAIAPPPEVPAKAAAKPAAATAGRKSAKRPSRTRADTAKR